MTREQSTTKMGRVFINLPLMQDLLALKEQNAGQLFSSSLYRTRKTVRIMKVRPTVNWNDPTDVPLYLKRLRAGGLV